MGQMFNPESFFGGMLPMQGMNNMNSIQDMHNMRGMHDMLDMLGEVSGFMPLAIPVIKANAVFPFTMRRNPGMIEQENTCNRNCGKSAAREGSTEVDEVMSKRRELNMQMRAAVENEEFEKAAELRDQIKELEASAEASGSDQQGKENGE
jgi:hypothetical protein